MCDYRWLVAMTLLAAATVVLNVVLPAPLMGLVTAVFALVLVLSMNAMLWRQLPYRDCRPLYRWTYSILPFMVVGGGSLFLRIMGDGQWVTWGMPVIATLFTLAIYAEYHIVDPLRHPFPRARLILNLATYLVAFAFYTVIYDLRIEGIEALLSILVVSFLLGLELFRIGEKAFPRDILHALVTGIIVSQVAWGLALWPIGGLVGGVFLLLVFYPITGIVQSYFLNGPSRGAVLEYCSVTLVGFVLLFGVRVWWGGM